MRSRAVLLAAALVTVVAGGALAQGSGSTPGNSASSSKEADKMRSGDKTGSLPNSSNPGSAAGADGNATQDSRTGNARNR